MRLLFILGTLLLFAVVLASGAFAHSWYSLKTDPVFKHSCCGGTDCNVFAAIPGETIIAEDKGYRIRLTAEQAKKVNPYTAQGIDALVEWDRVQPSEDGNWHICIMTMSRDNARGGIYCLFAPPNT